MDRSRIVQILDAEIAFARREHLARALAERGVYVVGGLGSLALRQEPADLAAGPKR